MSAGAGTGQEEHGRCDAARQAQYDLCLFVAGNEPNSASAKTSLERICTDHLKGNCRVEIVDVLEDPQPALTENILVTPALIIRRGPARTVVFGNLTNTDRVLAALGVENEAR